MKQTKSKEKFLTVLWTDLYSSINKDNELEYLSKDNCYDNWSGKTGHKEKHTEKEKGFDEVLNDVREKNINQPIMKIEHKFNKE